MENNRSYALSATFGHTKHTQDQKQENIKCKKEIKLLIEEYNNTETTLKRCHQRKLRSKEIHNFEPHSNYHFTELMESKIKPQRKLMQKNDIFSVNKKKISSQNDESFYKKWGEFLIKSEDSSSESSSSQESLNSSENTLMLVKEYPDTLSEMVKKVWKEWEQGNNIEKNNPDVLDSNIVEQYEENESSDTSSTENDDNIMSNTTEIKSYEMSVINQDKEDNDDSGNKEECNDETVKESEEFVTTEMSNQNEFTSEEKMNELGVTENRGTPENNKEDLPDKPKKKGIFSKMKKWFFENLFHRKKSKE